MSADHADHTDHADTIAVRVVAIEEVTPQIRRFTLEPVAGGELPAFSGGSHIIVVMRGAQRVYRNPYSLMSSPHDLGSYQISVLRVDPSRGGSAFMHEQVRVGSEIEIAHPVNLFALAKLARKHLLLAGGIGITPFMAQLHDLRLSEVPFELHYATRSPQHGAYCELHCRATRSRSGRQSLPRLQQAFHRHRGTTEPASRSAPTSMSADRPA